MFLRRIVDAARILARAERPERWLDGRGSDSRPDRREHTGDVHVRVVFDVIMYFIDG